ncbi:MAG: exodeoxyribonuclease V subunit alpha [Polyangiaceae bacterium]|nr:exodeoxyribonuclease V subunit alpha [Polyangiaceae bacterium]MCW5791007.1 exodeoxyribonuclease V subunit alpha [Polyangiaceae bacterium]
MKRLPLELLELRQQGALGAVDVELARALGRLVPSATPPVLLAAALASRAVQRGHVCLDLPSLARRALLGHDDQPVTTRLPGTARWLGELGASPLVARVDPAALREVKQGEAEPEFRPLVLDPRGRLYLHRYFDYQRRLAANLLARLTPREDAATDDSLTDDNPTDDVASRSFDAPLSPAEAALKAALCAVFEAPPGEPDLQRVAALVSTHSRFSVLSGGPGTGKTTTVVKILATLVMQAIATGEPPPRCLLLAPTGKAAARLAESISRGRAALKLPDEVTRSIPTEASTVHRALGYQPRTPTRFARHADDPLMADCVLVDECSMIDLPLLTKLVEAVHPSARLILIGDKDQLASVEAGAVLGDLFNPAAALGYSAELTRLARRLTGDRLDLDPEQAPPAVGAARALRDSMVHLTKSYRYAQQGGIGDLARHINEGEPRPLKRWLERLASPGHEALRGDAVALIEPAPGELEEALSRLVVEGFTPYSQASGVAERLARLPAFRVLAAHRVGPTGAKQLNQLCEQALRRAGLLPRGAGERTTWYEGQPILVTQNDYQLGLFNGDAGVIARGPGRELRAWFPADVAAPGAQLLEAPVGDVHAVRSVLAARLPPHETAYAMTVHKSQGSEFERVLFVLPTQASPLLTRELLYTAVTRARRHVTVLGSRALFAESVKQRIQRASGLSEALWGAAAPAPGGGSAAPTLPSVPSPAEQLKLF